jgi:OOP family OmpA-OmpF porin
MRHRVQLATCVGLVAAALIAASVVHAATASKADRDALAKNHKDPEAPCFRWPAVDMDEDGVYDRVDNCVNTPKGCVVDRFGCETDADHDGVCDGVDKCPNTPDGMKVDKNGCSEGSADLSRAAEPPSAKPVEHEKAPPPPAEKPVSEMERQLVEGGSIRLENVYFETNSASLLPESETTLNEAGRTLEKFANLRLEIQGHTDTRGAASYNLRLSQSRSESVRKYLLDHFSLSAENLFAKGYGETQPETREQNDEELLRNRRVVIKVLNPEALPRGVKIEK